MKTLLRSLLFMLVLLQGLSAEIRQEVDSLVAELPAYAATSTRNHMEIPELGPVDSLIRLGIDAVPHLIPHLSNMNMTRALRTHGSGSEAQISVNEIIGHVIRRSCDHYFYIASGETVIEYLGEKPIKSPETIALYQEQVKTWYNHFGNYKELGKLRDVDDWFHYNRFDAYKFFAENPSPRARLRLRAKMQILLTDPKYSSLTVSELISCSEAIASMGNVADLDLLKLIWTDLYEKPINTSGRDDDVKRLFRARVKLGDQQQAAKDIDAYNQKHAGKFPAIKIE